MKKTHLTIILLSLIWGSTWLAIKIGLGSMTPFYFAALRFTIASAVLLPFALRVGMQDMTMSPHMILVTGLLVIPIPYAVVYWGAQYISSGLTAVLFSMMPIFIAIYSNWILPDEKLSRMKLVGLVIGFLGVLLIYFDDIAVEGFRSSLGVVAVLAASVISSLGVVLVRREASRYHPILLTTIHFLIGAVILFSLAAITEDWSGVHFNGASELSLLYLALCGSALAFWLYYWLLTNMHVTKASLLVYVTPLIATYLGWVVLHEVITLQIALGTAFVLAGIKLAS